LLQLIEIIYIKKLKFKSIAMIIAASLEIDPHL